MKLYCSILLLSIGLTCFGQDVEDKRKKKLTESEIDLLYSYYGQQGNHSAVTGGVGTEDLRVNAPVIVIKLIADTTKTFTAEIGVDVITSASTDKIDFKVSSASYRDGRSHVKLGYGQDFPKSSSGFSVNTSLSLESDYRSIGVGGSYYKAFYNFNRQLSIGAQLYFDNLEWGWYNNFSGQKLIYPQELRGVNWFETVHRNSYMLSLEYRQVLNVRTQLSVFTDLVYQSGLLSTPFHRVYFSDALEPKVENLPMQRFKIPVGVRLNYLLKKRWAFRAYYRHYWDTFNIHAQTFQLEVPFKWTPALTLSGWYRIYNQSAADYFSPFREQSAESQYYSSDYDLSAFVSHKVGVGLSYYPYKRMRFKKKSGPEGKVQLLNLRYSYYTRSDGLDAHIFSFGLSLKNND